MNMKIGIITFHWATNYGAVLQAFALQEYLKAKGHVVEIINYKPRHYDFFAKYLYNPALLRFIRKDLTSRAKEVKIDSFRKKNLNLTKRYYSTKELCDAELNYDVVISGSDQVLNPFFTSKGERKPTSAYYLPFCSRATKIGYAVSFGCTEYTNPAFGFAKQWIGNFDRIGVRESTGQDILSQMGFSKQCMIVPDPTVLRGGDLIKDIIGDGSKRRDYMCVYMLRSSIKLSEDGVVYIDDTHNPMSMEDWFKTISSAKFLVTNSYHGMIVSILCHTPFAVILETTKYSGMNDRFYTILSKIGLESRIIASVDNLSECRNETIDWNDVEFRLKEFKTSGELLLGL